MNNCDYPERVQAAVCPLASSNYKTHLKFRVTKTWKGKNVHLRPDKIYNEKI